MNDFEKSMFIFFNEWGGFPLFSAEHEEFYFHGVDVDEVLGDVSAYARTDIMGNLKLFNQLFDLGWQLTEDGESFVSRRWGTS